MTSPNPLSVLDTTKKLLGFDPEYTAFDTDIIVHINTVFGDLQQLGVGPDGGFEIASNADVWTDFATSPLVLNPVKSYVYLKVRQAFDPPSTSFVIESLDRMTSELEWRINVAAEALNPPSDPFATT